MDGLNPYEQLGVDRDATEQQLRDLRHSIEVNELALKIATAYAFDVDQAPSSYGLRMPSADDLRHEMESVWPRGSIWPR
jgi:hypothetical protein